MAKCFVVQGFGKKTDFTDGRVLDLDASYAIIKEAVEAAGMECVRADEIIHSGAIDVPMYENLLHADLVIADLSTYNVNAAFELGVRYGLKPHATLIVAEEGFKNPFDVGHMVIRRYKHLGEDIGAKEAKRFRDDLKAAIMEILGAPKTDSPVYTFLRGLTPPRLPSDAAPAARQSPSRGRSDATLFGLNLDALLEAQSSPPNADEASAKSNLELAQTLLKASDFVGAKAVLRKIREQRPHDDFVVQQLALATYKSKQPDPETALREAGDLLQSLHPATTNDPETLGLCGAIYKRLWEITRADADLDASIESYGRGFNLKQDYYNGINLAFLLDLRGRNALQAGLREDGIADRVLARRTRRDVIRYTEPLLRNEYPEDKRYWILATLWEAAVGLGDQAAADRWEQQAAALQAADWMLESSRGQIQALRTIQAEAARMSGE